ncbi:LytTR family DNA-binding domain-containing protein [Niabella sp. W65]|nr:LytTR family DNA-binding domain-containing protein [Niabella sp. W65]MCH7364077.1 LytTR family DNA-binding domain-containing protein [Niabella sp. W65]ULT39956.1 LytTR family DNA-binding domain-containing protein [Niabella sp. I65]
MEPDIVFLDIDMPGLSGLEVASLLKNRTNIIFVTGHRQYGPEAYSLDAVDYILKPFSYERLVQAIEKVKQRILSGNSDRAFVFLHDAGRNEKIKLFKDDIQYIEALPNYTKVVTKDKQYLTSFKLKEAGKIISGSSFIRVHKSYVVNIQNIHTVTGNVIQMENAVRIPIGRSYKEAFMKRINL